MNLRQIYGYSHNFPLFATFGKKGLLKIDISDCSGFLRAKTYV